MSRLPRIAPLSLLLCLSVLPVDGQTGPETRSSVQPKSTPAKAAAAADAEQQLRTRRSQARSLLIALSTDARTFHDQTLRARSLARIADALWTVDAEQGRLLFRKAWEAAEVADQDSDRKLQDEIQQQKSKTGGGFAVNLPPNLRREVLRLVARRDRALGEEFLEKLKAQQVDSARNTLRPGRLEESLNQRLGVARGLLQVGEIERALEFADPALTVVAIDTINFLVDLRDKDATAADRRYAALLGSSATNPQADANTVSLLGSYIFTPRLYVMFTGNGVNTSQMAQKITPAEVSPELRNAFFQSAASILLRPLPQPGQEQPQGTAGLDGKFLVIKRLLPFFEQFAPAGMAESLRAQLNALNAIVSDETRRRDDEWINRGVRPERPIEDREQALLDRIDRAKTSQERDSLYIQLAQMAAGRGEMKARDYVSKVDDTEIRKQVQGYIDGQLANYFVEKKQTDKALEIVDKGDLTHLHKVWVLTRSAKELAATDKDKATELIETASAEARRIDVSDPALPQALIGVANAVKVVDAPRVWDATFDAVKAANSAQGFTGEDAVMVLKFQSKGGSSVNTNDAPEFNLEGIFKDLADQDYERAVELARGFEAEGPRAVATIAIARAVLDPKKRATAARN
jgi:tetratricopeptide (TPR) repeat protein